MHLSKNATVTFRNHVFKCQVIESLLNGSCIHASDGHKMAQAESNTFEVCITTYRHKQPYYKLYDTILHLH